MLNHYSLSLKGRKNSNTSDPHKVSVDRTKSQDKPRMGVVLDSVSERLRLGKTPDVVIATVHEKQER